MLTYNPIDRHRTVWNWAYQHDIFNAKELEDIKHAVASLPKEKGLTGNKKKTTSHRKSTIKWLYANNPDIRWILDRVGQEIINLNNLYYNYDLYGFDSIQYTTYKPKDYYDWHMDTMIGSGANGDPPRKLSATVLLNDDFKGGQFEFFTGQKTSNNPEMKAGTLIVFPSMLIHRVAPVTSGVRNSLVTWVLGPQFK